METKKWECKYCNHSWNATDHSTGDYVSGDICPECNAAQNDNPHDSERAVDEYMQDKSLRDQLQDHINADPWDLLGRHE